ncbi:hypothetical protein DZB84_16980 [Bacillus sp. HNG]|uniref:ATP-binding protein n=1 Tax=Bacillus sp. HNG TaxID=2293325 RepID=UPI000E2E8959|nr:ATP-binding protein [Bacillus sp. HNG]RFB13653.1 hypothetical protein DZB84_16980 [Bacillus sp. HNG]
MEVTEVFTAGGLPSITYFSRDNYRLEAKLRNSLRLKGKIISITGPTKSGKSVLCKKIIPPEKSVWVMGGHITEEEDLWNIITSDLNISVALNEEVTSEFSTNSNIQSRAGINLGIFKTDIGANIGELSKAGTKQANSYNKDLRSLSINFLIENQIPLLIDDFHYIERDVQKLIIRSLKGAISDGLKLILLAVPHRSNDAIEVEYEMTGRIYQIRVSPWGVDELAEIANKGFTALGITYPKELIDIFAQEAFGSPHLMQEFCQLICFENDIFEKSDESKELNTQVNFDSFFEEVINSSMSNIVFEKLANGPTNRGERKERDFKDGKQGDIYLAVLTAIGNMQNTNKITPDEIRKTLQDILDPRSVPPKQQITNVLIQMDKIAKNDIKGEPAIDFKDNVLYIVDPFLIFYLRWANLF